MLFLILGRIEQNGAEWIAAWLATWPTPSWLDSKDVAWIDPTSSPTSSFFAVLIAALALFPRGPDPGEPLLAERPLPQPPRPRLPRRRPAEARPRPFTGFDAADNVRMHKLVPRGAGRTILYPVINVALNVTASEKLAWQERKAEPFVFTPLYSGSAMLKPPEWPPQDARDVDLSEPPGAYVEFGRLWRQRARPGDGGLRRKPRDGGLHLRSGGEPEHGLSHLPRDRALDDLVQCPPRRLAAQPGPGRRTWATSSADRGRAIRFRLSFASWPAPPTTAAGTSTSPTAAISRIWAFTR